MNTGTLIGSLIMAAVLAVVIAFLIQAMMRGWRHRGERQAALIGTLPSLPDTVGAPVVTATKGLYVGSTLAPHWNDRVAVGDLGYRTKAVLTRYPEGIMLQRTGAQPIWIPDEAIPRSVRIAVIEDASIIAFSCPRVPSKRSTTPMCESSAVTSLPGKTVMILAPSMVARASSPFPSVSTEGMRPKAFGDPGRRITVRSGRIASPAARARNAPSMTSMHSCIGSRRSTSRSDRMSVST